MALTRRGKKGIFYLVHYRDGRHRYVSLRTTDKRVAEYKAAQLLQQHADTQQPAAFRTVSLSDAVTAYLDDIARRLRASHVAKCTERLRRLKAELGVSTLRSLTTDVASRTLNRLAAAHDWSPKTYNHYRNTLATFCQWCVDRDWLATHPLLRVPTRRVPVNEIDYLQPEEIQDCLATFAGHWLLPGVAIAIYGGLRRGEVARLEWSDVDLTAKEITVRNSARGWTKSARFRVVPMSEGLVALLRPLAQPKGSVLGRSTRLTKTLEKVRARLALSPRWTWLVFRHTFFTHHALAGTPLTLLREWGGHTDPKTTARYYIGRHRTYHPAIEAFGPSAESSAGQT